MSPLNSSNVDSQGIKFELDDSNKTAKIIGYVNLSISNIIIKRGVENTNGTIYKVTSMTSNCLTNATSITSIMFDKTKLDEFQYESSGFPSNLTEVKFKDQTLTLSVSPPSIGVDYDNPDFYGVINRSFNGIDSSNEIQSIHSTPVGYMLDQFPNDLEALAVQYQNFDIDYNLIASENINDILTLHNQLMIFEDPITLEPLPITTFNIINDQSEYRNIIKQYEVPTDDATVITEDITGDSIQYENVKIYGNAHLFDIRTITIIGEVEFHECIFKNTIIGGNITNLKFYNCVFAENSRTIEGKINSFINCVMLAEGNKQDERIKDISEQFEAINVYNCLIYGMTSTPWDRDGNYYSYCNIAIRGDNIYNSIISSCKCTNNNEYGSQIIVSGNVVYNSIITNCVGGDTSSSVWEWYGGNIIMERCVNSIMYNCKAGNENAYNTYYHPQTSSVCMVNAINCVMLKCESGKNLQSFSGRAGTYAGFRGSYAYNCVCKDCKNNYDYADSSGGYICGYAGFIGVSYCYNCIALNNKGFNNERNDYFENQFLSRCIGDVTDFVSSNNIKNCLKLNSVSVDLSIFPYSVLNLPVIINVNISDGIYISNTYYKIANGNQIPRTGNELFVLTGSTTEADKLIVQNNDGTDINVKIMLNNCNFDNRVNWATTAKHENFLDTGYITVKYYIEGTNIISAQASCEFIPGRNTTTTFTSIGGGSLTLTNAYYPIGVFENGFLDTTPDNTTLLIDDKANLISATLKGIEYTDYLQMFRDGFTPGNKPLILTFGSYQEE